MVQGQGKANSTLKNRRLKALEERLGVGKKIKKQYEPTPQSATQKVIKSGVLKERAKYATLESTSEVKACGKQSLYKVFQELSTTKKVVNLLGINLKEVNSIFDIDNVLKKVASIFCYNNPIASSRIFQNSILFGGTKNYLNLNDLKHTKQKGNFVPNKNIGISNTQKKKLGWNPLNYTLIPKDVEILHNLWLAYIRKLLNNTVDPLSALDSLEYHGAHLRVVASPVPHYVGLQGIVIKLGNKHLHFAILSHKVDKDGTEMEESYVQIKVVPKSCKFLLNIPIKNAFSIVLTEKNFKN